MKYKKLFNVGPMCCKPHTSVQACALAVAPAAIDLPQMTSDGSFNKLVESASPEQIIAAAKEKLKFPRNMKINAIAEIIVLNLFIFIFIFFFLIYFLFVLLF
jgi:hypothetical protein